MQYDYDKMIVTCIDYNHDGWGVAKQGDKCILVPFLLLSETAEVQIVKATRRYQIARIIRLLTPSPARAKSNCHLFKQCGGCQLMHMSYSEQTEFKQLRILNAFLSIAKTTPPLNPFVTAPAPLEYRNNVKLPVTIKDGQLRIGFYRQNSNQVVPLKRCPLQVNPLNTLLKRLIPLLTSFHAKFPLTSLRHLYFRHGAVTNDVILTLVTASYPFPGCEELFTSIKENNPEITSLVINLNQRPGNVILGPEYHTIYGPGKLREVLQGYQFEIHPAAFLQVNAGQMEQLYRLVTTLPFKSTDIVIEAYSGIGILATLIAPHVNHVYALEIDPSAVNDGRNNAKANNINNITYLCGDVDAVWPAITPDYLIVDPPRKGLAEAFITRIKQHLIPHLIYISCDPGTLARDYALLKDTYQLTRLTPVDMFPQTIHVECVLVLTRN